MGFSDYDRNHKNHDLIRFAVIPYLRTLNICLNLWEKRIQFHTIRISYLTCKN